MTKIPSWTSPIHRKPTYHGIWAKKCIRTIVGRESLRQKEIDLFSLRHNFHKSKNLQPTIVGILRYFEERTETSFLAKSILIELGEEVSPIGKNEVFNVFGRRLFHLVRLILLTGKIDETTIDNAKLLEARAILSRKTEDEAGQVRLMLLRSDPNPLIRQHVPYLEQNA
jgi:hypothetical protein